MDYEQKYKAALGWMQGLYNGLHGKTKEEAETYFPELKESEDERIKQSIIADIKSRLNNCTHTLDDYYKQQIAWLKKQESVGEIVERCKTSWYNEGKIQGQIEGLSDDEKYLQGWHDALEKQGLCSPFDYEHANIPQKDFSSKVTPKIEPKFKIGDYVVTDYIVGKIFAITDDSYLLDTGQGIPFSSNNVHLWTIKDAKDGDVLYSPCCKLIWLYKDEKTCYLGNNLNYDSIVVNSPICIPTDARPATKEQRELLFKKMRENGYYWNRDTKTIAKY